MLSKPCTYLESSSTQNSVLSVVSCIFFFEPYSVVFVAVREKNAMILSYHVKIH